MAFSFRDFDGTQVGTTTITFDLKDSEGEVALYSDLGSTIAINHWNGGSYTAYTSGGTAVVLDTSNSQALIQGPGSFQIVLPTLTNLSIVPSLEALMSNYAES